MNILVACEESQRVTMAFRERGHNAFSCDLLEESGGHPEWHIQQDVLPLLGGDCTFQTIDGKSHSIEGKWDMILAFPPCTFLTSAGNRWFNVERYGEKALQRIKDREAAAQFFLSFVNADCDKIIIENPTGYMNSHYRKPDQIIQPWQFGHSNNKRTCLWLKGVSPLQPTNIVEKPKPTRTYVNSKGQVKNEYWEDSIAMLHLPKDIRSRERSKTWPGVAKAMAEQWG